MKSASNKEEARQNWFVSYQLSICQSERQRVDYPRLVLSASNFHTLVDTVRAFFYVVHCGRVVFTWLVIQEASQLQKYRVKRTVNERICQLITGTAIIPLHKSTRHHSERSPRCRRFSFQPAEQVECLRPKLTTVEWTSEKKQAKSVRQGRNNLFYWVLATSVSQLEEWERRLRGQTVLIINGM